MASLLDRNSAGEDAYALLEEADVEIGRLRDIVAEMRNLGQTPPTPEDVKNMIEAGGGKVGEIGRLPDGSGFAIASFPLPKDHWIYKADADGFTTPPPMPFRMGYDDPRRPEFNEMVSAAARYAIQASTMCGQDIAFDPDAMVMNFIVGMLGYHTKDGLSGETFGNPVSVPEPYPGKSF